MQTSTTSEQTTAAKRSSTWLSASFASETQLITDPQVEIPQLLRIASLTFKQRAASAELRKLDLRHRDFSARHESDDPAHEEFREGSERLRYAIAGYGKALNRELEALQLSIELDRVQVVS